MERKRKPANQGNEPSKKQKTSSVPTPANLNQLGPNEVLVNTSDPNIKWIGPLSEGKQVYCHLNAQGDKPSYKGFVRSGSYFRLGQCVHMTTDQPEPWIAEVVRLFEGQDDELRAEVR